MEDPWNLHGVTWSLHVTCMELCGVSWSVHEESSRSSIEVAWKLHAVPCRFHVNSMEDPWNLHGFPWISMEHPLNSVKFPGSSIEYLLTKFYGGST